MNKVHILSKDVISKIAAGEVIERPSSVIKELVENSIDAQATSIYVALNDAGKKLIKIKDNGTGIAQSDLEVIFNRHATSKIKNIEDLQSIYSMGFRGEALFSIAAISDITLRSKTADQDTGWEIHFRGGKKQSLKPCAMTDGTEITIKELFFNTPVRRKFLKSNTTEINQILNLFVPYTLVHPNIQFKLIHQGRDLIDLNTNENSSERLAESLHLDKKHLIETEQVFEQQNLSIKMILGDMNIKRSRRDMQFVFINNRPVFNRSISFHLNKIYDLIFPPNVYPAFGVFIQMPAEDMDVNIHPTKREVKLRDEQSLCSLLRRLCEQALMTHGQAKQVSVTNPMVEQETKEFSGSFSRLNTSSIAGFQADNKEVHQYAYPNESVLPSTQERLFTEHNETLRERLQQTRFVGRFSKKFLLFEIDQTLFVVDQHAAQERIMYERFQKQIQDNDIEVQNLLTPELVQVSSQELLSWEDSKGELEKAGFASTQFDDQTIAVHSHPTFVKGIEQTFRTMLSGEETVKGDHDQIARRACRSSVMAGDILNDEQAINQRDELVACRDPFTCPHGRPTVIELTEGFLDKQFLRT